MSLPLINSPDGFEYVRDAIANILATESAAQVLAADAWNAANPTETQLISNEWVLDVYTERSNSFELFLDDDNDTTQVVNVWYDNSNVDKRSTQTKQVTTSTFNVDCIACATAEETTPGHDSGDELAARRAQKVARLCRRILMHPDYRLLGLPSIVGTRMMTVRTASPKGANEITSKHVDGVQLQFDVSHSEIYDYAELSASEGALVTIYREPGGPVIAQMDYSWV